MITFVPNNDTTDLKTIDTMNHKSTIYAAMTLVVTALLMVGCGKKPAGATLEFKAVSKADSLIFERGQRLDYQGMLALTDSFERVGTISEIAANRWRGVAYNYLGSVRKSEFYYKKVFNAPIKIGRAHV